MKILFKAVILLFLSLSVAGANTSPTEVRYDINLNIGGRVFVDELILFINEDGPITGIYKVPGSFESEVSDFYSRMGQFGFKIHVVEGEDDYHALFEGIMDKGKLKGRAYILPTMKPLGDFTGEKK